MNKYRIFIAILGGCFVMNASVSAKIYQCEVDGKKVFQDHLCEAVESQQEVAVVENIKSEFTEQERRLINNNEVAIGMSEKALLKSRGEPDQKLRSGRGAEQWLYQGEDGRFSQVVVINGKVYDWRD
ncbi:hypothetical protein FLM48_17655 [Shewanella sp. Scap07]|uniref:hypothetical protein n=1 Tax=Shewanella sp. Scap07 TaxID=2589987 RepID=UPI0015BAC757|nr:hypothetical protein [Shewanella sp. Scap07]QLE86734.1 hypothetical protein FLM48_17655 [Shewanella sp. Scap07]